MNLFTLVLLLLALSGCSSEVVPDFTQKCPEFFADPKGDRSSPTVFPGNDYKQICQKREDTYEYATLYDTANRIPVYSAYKFEGLQSCIRIDKWFIEPQLEDLGPQMISESNMIQKQAVNQDYEKKSRPLYDKGHLAPVYHARSKSCADATFTLTNAAPQDRSFNRGQWRKTEEGVAEDVKQKCKGNCVYIVTGVVPDYNKPLLNNKVRIPSHFWTAYCCLDNNLGVTDSRGFIGSNINVEVDNITVSELEGKLTTLYGKGTFQVFGGYCH
ncbi:hypothetical protein AOLI_G00242430 [Acnodon oligacanthus]